MYYYTGRPIENVPEDINNSHIIWNIIKNESNNVDKLKTSIKFLNEKNELITLKK